MDQYNDWYERYQPAAPHPSGYNNYQPRQSKQRKGVSIPALICCMLVTMLVGGALGGLFAKSYVDQSLAAINDNAQATAQAAAAAAPSDQMQTETPSTTTASAALQSGSASGYSKAQVIELCAPAVVGIDTTYEISSGYGFGGFGGGPSVATGSGSGIILTSDGYIVTCAHVVDGASTVTVVLNDDTPHTATLVGTDARNDLAVIKIDATGLTPATLGDSDMLTVGEDVVAIGNPLGELRGTATGGMISALGREVSVETKSQIRPS